MLTETLITVSCGDCGVEHAMPNSMYRNRKDTGTSWYCPNGHRISFNESFADKLAAEVARSDQLKAKNKTLRGEKSAVQRKLNAQRGATTRIKNRVGNGVCPCCNRSFQNLRRHMDNKHPDFKDG